MAVVTYSPEYSDITDWPGGLFEGTGTTSFTSKSATSATLKHGSGHNFANYTIKFSGSGFTYDGNTVTGGVLKSVTIFDDKGNTVISFTKIGAATLGADFAHIAAAILGLVDGNGDSIGPEAKGAWSHLMSGADTINGTEGNDNRTLVGLDAGNDTYNMLGGDDRMAGGIGNDKYNGGDGFDRLSFSETTFSDGSSAFRGINVNMTTLKVTDCWGGTDTLDSVEDVQGSCFADKFLGSAGDDQFAGLAGRDSFDGAGGSDDKVYYYDDVWSGGGRGIVADLTAGTIRDGFGNIDKVKNIEWVIGTSFNDSFTGSGNRDVFIGDDGVDSYDGKGNPADSGESDRIQFNWTFSENSQHGINVDLSKASGQIIDDGYGNTENAVNIEGIVGSNQDDTIKGSKGTNLFAGADGQDTMTGNGGTNEFNWWDIEHFGDGDVITDFDTATDKLSFDDSIGIDALRLENDLSPSTTSGTFLFDSASHTLFWDANGSAAGQRFAIVELIGVTSLTTANFEIY